MTSDVEWNRIFSKLCKENSELRLALYWIRYVAISTGENKLDTIAKICDHTLIDAMRTEILDSAFAPPWVVDIYRSYNSEAAEKEALK